MPPRWSKPAPWALLPLVLAGFSLILAAPAARAQAADYARLRVNLDHQGALGIPKAPGLFPGEWQLGLVFQGAHKPLTWRYDDGSFDPAINRELQFDFHGAVGILPLFDLGLSFPFIVQQTTAPGSDLPALTGSTTGDLRLQPRVTLVYPRSYGFGLALIGEVSLPTGSNQRFTGESGVAFRPTLVSELKVGPITTHGSLGLHFRPNAQFATADFSDELWLRGGVSWPYERWTLTGELGAAWAMFRPGDRDFLSLEFLGGVRRHLGGPWHAHVGGGVGLVQGIGTPEARWLIGIAYRAETQDRDADGIPDRADACVDRAEDYDRFADVDGCPDRDNDGDGIPDVRDRCPNEPEDINDIRDEDGCPDAGVMDQDGDDLPDVLDPCPVDPIDGETLPDACRSALLQGDADGDGIRDQFDVCPKRAEDQDGFQDGDGCPDPDNDFDGVPDRFDRCPDEQEVINGLDDLDGCADGTAGIDPADENRIELRGEVQFSSDSDEFLPDAYPLLYQVALLLLRNDAIQKLRIEGHTDGRGDDATNLVLSQQRAERVKKFLAAQGVDPRRLEAVGYGETRPIASNRTARGQARNRRVEFVITRRQ